MPPNQDIPLKISLATAALCSCSLIHAYVLISVFPYAGYMVIDLIPRLTTETAGPQAGLLAASFMAGRASSSYPWGMLADTYGRKAVLISSLLFSALFSLLFGTSQSFVGALVFRFLLGLSNGIVGTVKTVVSEMAANKRDLETRIMGLVVGMRAWGFLISPAIGGWLCEPLKQYPWLSTEEDASNSFWYTILSKYPFILPNLFGTLLCTLTALVVAFCIPETLPSDLRQDVTMDCSLASCIGMLKAKLNLQRTTSKKEESASLLTPAPIDNRKSNKEETSIYALDNQTENSNGRTDTTTTPSMLSFWHNQSTKDHLLSYWHFSLAVACLDDAFPLFCIASKGGLGLSEGNI